MKHSIKRVISLLSLSIIFSSCFPEEEYPDYGSYLSFVTVNKAESDTEPSKIVLRDDSDRILNVLEDPYLLLKVLKPSQRAVGYFDPIDCDIMQPESIDVRLCQVDTCVFISKTAFVETEKDLDSLGSDSFQVNESPYFPSITSKYINLFIGTFGINPYLHKFTTAYVSESQNTSEPEKLYLHFCHNANKDTSGYQYWHWVSIPLEDFKYLFPEKDNLILKIRNLGAMDKTINFSLKNLPLE